MTTTTNGIDEGLASAFRQHLPDLTSPRFTTSAQQSPYEYSEAFQKTGHPPWLYKLTKAWEQLLEEPFQGVTADGKIRHDVFRQEDFAGAQIDKIVNATNTLLDKLDSSQKSKVQYSLNAREWRCWSNPEFLLRPFGLRLEELSEETAQSILGIMEATFSSAGYQKALAAMRVNHFLGEVCKVPRIMNQYSYNFLLFGKPSADQAWGWSIYGHHLCLNVFLKGTQIVVAPYFTGAEPNLIDSGPWKGTQILHTQGDLGLKLMQSLPKEQQQVVQTYKLLRDPAMLQTGDVKIDRWNQDDQRHLCGAFRDNRVVPYEGVKVSEMTADQQNTVLEIAEEFLLYYPDSTRAKQKQLIRKHFDETYFSWIGGFGDDDAFYYRIQSPVIIFEFDHHSGVFLTNTEPAKFHTHTICRLPNAGDYGQIFRSDQDRVP
ncbi:hypothetical protein CKM354_000195200 [Cercospora kikuchii]|uniref:DUF3500 domain-containing protein n=1 Tax=Cercospora kikuchii TaxID=84275 RepID=A0A9P3F8S7_9PEZI|nr:uncharacterized protein CKM354_000195200 [Cercospora kikuchii]GIZ38536.1 hypothetical protein CKM354_000195200 [Cercospora kikuchii]